MKIWLSKNSEVPVREQLITQITLGIASGDLAVGTRLPSTREIAQRYKIHPNTVSNAYQILAENGWLEFKKGSGFYVCESKSENPENSLDKLIAQFVQTAQNQGYSIAEIKNRWSNFFESSQANQLFIIENDLELREILIEEIQSVTKIKISGASFEDFAQNLSLNNAVFAAMFDERAKIGAVLPNGQNCHFLKANSVADSMKDKQRPTANDLIAVVSGWEKFLVLSKTMLLAAKIEPESLIFRTTKDKSWSKGLNAVSMIICDSLTAKHLSDFQNVRPFRLIADESLNVLSQLR